jgi:hypothetical protein
MAAVRERMQEHFCSLKRATVNAGNAFDNAVDADMSVKKMRMSAPELFADPA